MILDPTLSEWLNLLFRWIHVFAGIMWVGTTYYFTWLDARLTEEEKAAASTGVTPQVWMVHSGGFYVVERRNVPDLASRTLHYYWTYFLLPAVAPGDSSPIPPTIAVPFSRIRRAQSSAFSAGSVRA